MVSSSLPVWSSRWSLTLGLSIEWNRSIKSYRIVLDTTTLDSNSFRFLDLDAWCAHIHDLANACTFPPLCTCKWTDCVCVCVPQTYASFYMLHMYSRWRVPNVGLCISSVIAQTRECTFAHVHTHTPVYGYQAEPLIFFHSDTWFPWEACDTTREQKGTWTQPSAYLQHTPLLIKDN